MSSSISVDGPLANPSARGSIYRFIRPRRSLKKEILAQQRSNSISGENENESDISGNHRKNEHLSLWKKASSLRQSLRAKTISSKNKDTEGRWSRLCRSNSQFHVGNKDNSLQKEWGSQRDLRLSTSRKEFLQSQPRFSQDLERPLLSDKHSRSLSDYCDISKLPLRNTDVSAQHSLNSSLTSLPSQHVQVNNSEDVLPQLYPTYYLKSARKLSKDSRCDTGAQKADPDYINADWLGKGGEIRMRTSLSSVHNDSQYQSTHRTSAPTVLNSRFCMRPEKEGKEQVSRLPINYFPHQSEVPSVRRSQNSSVERRKGPKEQYLLHSTLDSRLQQYFTAHKEHEKCRILLNNCYLCLESYGNWRSSQLVSDSNPNELQHAVPSDLHSEPSLNSQATNSYVNTFFTTPSLDEDTDMVTRRFKKKGSVYEALASKSGLDFAPVIQGRPYWERNESAKSLTSIPQSSGGRQSIDFTGHCQSIISNLKESKSSEFSAKNKIFFSQENLTYQTHDSKKQRSEINKENLKSFSFSSDLSLDVTINAQKTNRENSPPPPPPPIRKSSMIHQRSGLTHEKYPSWPVSSESPELSPSSLPVTVTSYRSHSWTDQTDYPKVRAVYSRPKKSFKISTNQLQPVLEKRIDGYGTKRAVNNESTVPIPLSNRTLDGETTIAEIDSSLKQALCRSTSEKVEEDTGNRPSYIPMCYGDKEYNIHSPPERDVPINQMPDSLALKDTEPYWNKYDDFIKHYNAYYSSACENQITCYSNTDKDVEFHNFKMPESLENETPFLDRLRLECQAFSATWPPPPGSDFLETPSEAGTLVESSGSGSSQETLKWHGSYSDLSTFSIQMSNRSSLFDSGLSTMPDSGRLTPQSSCDGSTSTNRMETSIRTHVPSRHGLQRESIAHSSKVQPAKRHDSESVLYYAPGLKHSYSRSSKSVRISSSKEEHLNTHEISGISVAQRIKMLQQQVEERKSIKPSVVSSPFAGFSRAQTLLERPNSNRREVNSLVKGTAHVFGSINNSSKTINPEQFPTISEMEIVSTPVLPNCSARSSVSEPDDAIQRVLYLDPDKKHCVSDPELRTTQKKAVLSFYQRQKGISESQPAGQELSLSITTAPPVDSPKKRITSQEMNLSTIVQQTNDMNDLTVQSPLSLPEHNMQCLWSSLPHLKVDGLEFNNTVRSRSSGKLGYVPEESLSRPENCKKTENFLGRSSEQVTETNYGFFHQHSFSVPNLNDLQFNSTTPYSQSSSSRNSFSSQLSNEPLECVHVDPPVTFNCSTCKEFKTNHGLKTTLSSNIVMLAIQGAQDSKQIVPDNGASSNGTSYFRSYKSPRKAQVKEIHHSNETATVKVITPDGITLVETVGRSDISREETNFSTPPKIPPRRIGKQPPPPPHQRPSRPPPPPPSSLQQVEDKSNHDTEDVELSFLHQETVGQTTSIRAQNEYVDNISVTTGGASTCSSPELPLPPPPSITDIEIRHSDEPLPPPPDPQEVELPTKTLPQISISERKLGRHGFDGNYWRSSSTSETYDPTSKTPHDGQNPVSPASWEKLHNIRKQGTTLIFHSNSIRDRTWSDSRCLLNRGPSCSSSEAKLPSAPTTSLQFVNSLVNDQPGLSGPVNEESSISERVGQDPQHEYSSHGSFSPQGKLTLSQTSKQAEPQKDYSSFNNQDVCVQYQSKISVHCTEPLQKEVTEQSNIAVNHNEALKIHENSTIVPQNDANLFQGQQVGGESSGQLTVCRINSATQTTDTPRLGRKCMTQEEIVCERLSKDFVSHCDDTVLKNLLVPAPNHKTMSDYMEGLFNLELEKGGQPVRRKSSIRAEAVNQASNSAVSDTSDNRDGSELPVNSAYCTTSEVKLLIQHSKDTEHEDCTKHSELCNKKEELIASIDRKLEVLRLEHIALREEMAQNEIIGKEVTSRVEQLAKSNELEKYKLHVEELGKIINLLLSLSGRLARSQNALLCLPKESGQEERQILQAKCDKLSRQHEEARRLKESIDKRSHQVSTFLHRYLSSEEYADYDYFIKMKSKLLMDAREIGDKIKLGEEQLAALHNNMNFQIWKQAQTKTQISP
ncbi:uncharacterized protein LOC106459967 isoform X2 [Limulus polyphemus]|uniref:Uncharacterized protein LOC106459967 isoform X2 n=1 Tax=Limulus polyphemus TaxID=6850 RepID=A0ABM1SF51_LIMPO|nr:uncharacterized protein LOC106459967 isoform X2 [Limulus polyphemus]